MILPLYIHVPFCRSKCGYCTFFSVTSRSVDLYNRYIEELKSQINYFTGTYNVSTYKTVYIGGGTPSSLSLPSLESLLNYIDSSSEKRPEEFTIECNPEDMTEDFLNLLDNSPVDRISLGVQSFSPHVLEASGRNVSSGSIDCAIDLIKNRWKRRFSLDIITGLPGQTLKGQENDILRAVDTGADHISCYSLILDSSVPVSSSPLLPGDEAEEEMWELSRTILINRGFSHYEISNFARPGKESIHNMEYWKMNPFLGCGPGAVGMVPGGKPVRMSNPASLNLWLEGKTGNWHMDRDIIEPAEFLFENYMMGLRTEAGIDRRSFIRRFGHDPEYFIPGTLRKSPETRFIINDKTFSLSAEARLFLNSILLEISDELEYSEIDFEVIWP